jgi:hypothetical protein
MQRSLKTRLLVRVAAGLLACVGATVGVATAANAAPAAGQASADRAAADRALAVGPYSLQPGPNWFFYYAFAYKNDCDYYGFLLVANGYATGSTCSLRYDLSGYDLWLRN